MINFHPTFRQLLLTAVDNSKPVVYEVFRKEEDVPCISYMEINNSNTLSFETYSGEWLDFIVDCRSGKDTLDYDVIIGGIANVRSVDGMIRYLDGLSVITYSKYGSFISSTYHASFNILSSIS